MPQHKSLIKRCGASCSGRLTLPNADNMVEPVRLESGSRAASIGSLARVALVALEAFHAQRATPVLALPRLRSQANSQFQGTAPSRVKLEIGYLVCCRCPLRLNGYFIIAIKVGAGVIDWNSLRPILLRSRFQGNTETGIVR
eukprot:4228715-Pyramimonas_sp.AAC.1